MKHSICSFPGIGYVLVILFAFFGCKRDAIPEAPYEGPLQFILDARHNELLSQDITLFKYADDVVYGLLPTGEGEQNVYTLTVKSPEGSEVLIDGLPYPSDTISIAMEALFQCTVVDRHGKAVDYQVQLFPDPEIPVFWIETDGGAPIVSKDDYIDAVLRIDPGRDYRQEERLIPTEIRGRGNSTWGMPKKPYRMKFRDGEALLGFEATKNWVLLANYSDKTLLRNDIAFEMGRELMSGFIPRTRFVEVYLNGQYEGVYHLTDQIRVEADRVDIDELDEDEEDTETVTGGYLLEIDDRLDADRWFYSGVLGFPFTFKSPEQPNDVQFDYITRYIDEVETILADPDISRRSSEYEALIDVASFVNYYIVSEVVRNNDTGGGLSIYMHKPRGGKLAIGPLWDFDIAMGNINYNGNEAPEGWLIKTKNHWYKGLFKDPKFVQAVKDRWQEVMPAFRQTVLDRIDSMAFGTLHVAQQRNFQRWDILNEWVWPNYDVFGSYDAEVDYLKTWLTTRIDWMDAEISRW